MRVDPLVAAFQRRNDSHVRDVVFDFLLNLCSEDKRELDCAKMTRYIWYGVVLLLGSR